MNQRNNSGDYSLNVNVISNIGDALSNIPVKLLNSSRSILTTDNTDESGLITFSNLQSGEYYLRINKQSGYESFEDYPVSLISNEEVTLTLISE